VSRRKWYLMTNAVVLGWILLALVAVFVHRFVDHPLWLMVHLPLLGAATAAILIWSQHFADTLLRRPAPAGRTGLGVRLASHTAGVVAVVTGVMIGSLPVVVAGAATVAAVAVTHGILLTVQLRHALPARFSPLVRYYIAAAAVFVVGISAGAAMTWHPEWTDRLVFGHIILNVYGWIGLTALGTLVLLWPTVLHARIIDGAEASAARSLPILVTGLLVAAAGSIVDLRPLVPVGLVVWLVGAVLLGTVGWRQARSMPPGTYAGWSLGAAYLWILAAAVILSAQSALIPGWPELREASLIVLGPLVIGFGAQLLLGALSFLLPVVAVGSPAGAKAAAEMLDHHGLFRVVAFNGAVLLYLAPMPSIARVLLSFIAVGVVIDFLVLAARALVKGYRTSRSVRAEGASPQRAPVDLGMPAAQRPGPRRPRATAVSAAASVLILAVAVGVAADPSAVGISTVAAPPSAVTATGQATEVTVRVDGMRYDPAIIEVPYGDQLVVHFENTGSDVHDLTFANGIRSARLAPGENQTLDLGVIGADLDGWCSIAGHRQMGMVLQVKAVGAPAHGDDIPSDAAPQTSEGASAAELVDLQREPVADFTPWPASLPPATEQTVHRVTLRVEEVVTDVAAGVAQTRWTFGGTAPGPVLRGRIGDRFEITLVNDGTIGHSIDFHAGALAPEEPMRTIAPSETLTYTFTATRAGIWMYHCSTMPMSMHIANGMFGAVIIDPPGLVPVDREYVLVQGELYLGTVGGVADAEKIASQLPDLVAFNGYADQYVHAPLSARVGERVRVWVLDAGPNTPTSFHVVGGQFDTVYREGAYDLVSGSTGGSQALGLEPAQGGFVELVFPEAGDYPFVTHRMSDAEKGARGVFRVE